MTKQLLSGAWISRLEEFSQIYVGFSGGLDSTVLLHVLSIHPSLSTKLVAVHINHGISVNSQKWQNHCQQICRDLEINFIAQSVEFDRSANVEERARTARYVAFSSMLTANDCLILGHHLADQAETLLLQLFRGAGVDGLAAMTELGQLGLGVLVRPFLSCSREQLEHYAAAHQLIWVEDESNEDIHYSRNYLRHQVIPLLVKQWPGAIGNIARAATHCQQAKVNLDDLALCDCPELISPKASLGLDSLKTLSFERQSNVLRVWLKKNQIQLPSTGTIHRLIHEVILASPDAMPIVSWNEVQVRRYQQHLYLVRKEEWNLTSHIDWTEFPKSLVFADKTIKLTAKKVHEGLVVSLNAKIQVRFRRGGEDFSWHGQTKQLKKLFQEWEIPPWQRDKIPLIYINDQLAAVVGYAISDLFYAKNQQGIWAIEIRNC